MSISVNIKKRLGDFLLNVRFDAENETLALLGASGCGKSVTLQCIAGLLTPDEGRIVIDGVTLFDAARRINLPPQKRQVGLLFQSYALFPNMTVAQNIAAGLHCRKIDRQAHTQALIASFHLAGLEHHYPTQLSGGQQQRTALARMLAAEPKLVMLDEPFSALDEHLRWQLEQELVATLERFGGTAIYVSHNREEVRRICRKICLLDEGHSEPVVSVAELFQHPQTRSAALMAGCKNFSRLALHHPQQAAALDWGCILDFSCDLPPDVQYVAVHSHNLALANDKPMMQGRILQIAQSAFSTALTVQLHNAALLHMELPLEQTVGLGIGAPLGISIAPQKLLLLR